MLKKIREALSSRIEKYLKHQEEIHLSSSHINLDTWREGAKIIKEIDAIEGVNRAIKNGEEIRIYDDDIKINGWSIKGLWEVESDMQSLARSAIINAMECYVEELRRRLEVL